MVELDGFVARRIFGIHLNCDRKTFEIWSHVHQLATLDKVQIGIDLVLKEFEVISLVEFLPIKMICDDKKDIEFFHCR